jgi:hypothetical protein
MSAKILQLPALNQTVAQVRLARWTELPADVLSTAFTDWLFQRVIEGRITQEMAEAICRYQEQAA